MSEKNKKDWKVKVWIKIAEKDMPDLIEEKIFKDKTEKEMRNNTLPKTHRATIEVYDTKQESTKEKKSTLGTMV
jgi:hypothetical protein